MRFRTMPSRHWAAQVLSLEHRLFSMFLQSLREEWSRFGSLATQQLFRWGIRIVGFSGRFAERFLVMPSLARSSWGTTRHRMRRPCHWMSSSQSIL